ncbi:MAG: GNAT family N-acetyltransferase [Bacteroidota bacterium]
MSRDTALPPVVQNTAKRRFEADIDGQLAFAEYILTKDGRLVITHTEVPPALEGQGIASHVIKAALDHARAANLQVMPLCPFAAAYIRRHSEYRDLVMPGFRL